MTNDQKPARRRDAEKTKARILAAAQQAFSAKGYAQTGIRDIAAMADVSSPLLLRYFGSKVGLFEAALMNAMQVERLLAADRAGFGRHLAGLLVDPEREIIPPSIIALSTGEEEIREIASNIISGQILQPLAAWLGPPQGDARALEIVMLALGFLMFVRHYPLANDVEGGLGTMQNWFAETVQAIVDRS